jgi:thiamine pyrophosphate-dependent acetolactate synthase large subunit-like protein
MRAETLARLAWSGESSLPTPYEVIAAARAESADDSPLTVDAGAHMLLAMTLWEAREPRCRSPSWC